MKAIVSEQYLRTDEAEDVAGSIRHVLRTLEWVDSDPHAWKWVALALHSALQGACVCHLVGTAPPMGIVSEKDECKWIAYFNNSHANPIMQPPSTHILALPDLLKKLRKPGSCGFIGYDAYDVKIDDRELKMLIDFHYYIRNEFTHFDPKGWSIETDYIARIFALTSRIITCIGSCGWAFRNLDQHAYQDLLRDLERLKDHPRSIHPPPSTRTPSGA